MARGSRDRGGIITGRGRTMWLRALVVIDRIGLTTSSTLSAFSSVPGGARDARGKGWLHRIQRPYRWPTRTLKKYGEQRAHQPLAGYEVHSEGISFETPFPSVSIFHLPESVPRAPF